MNLLPHILRSHPIVKSDIVRAQDCYLFDGAGRKYTDFESGIWCTSLGHTHRRIVECINAQAKKVIHLGPLFTPYLAEETAIELLKTTSMEMGRAVLLSSGSEAVELGIRLALLYTKRENLLTFSRSYLGAYGMAGRIGSGQQWQYIDIDICLGCEHDCAWSCPSLEHVRRDNIGALVLEPVLASGGIIIPPKKTVLFLADEIRRAGGLILSDEVTTGLGRAGKWLGIEHFGIQPDIVAFGKTLGNGYPVSALLMNEKLAGEVESRDFRYVQSHQNDPLGCVVAREVLAVLKDEKLVARSSEMGICLKEELAPIAAHHDMFSDLRGLGLMVGMGLRADMSNDDRLPETIAEKMLKRGYIIGFKAQPPLLRFLPPFTIERQQIRDMCSNLSEVLSET